MATMIAAKRRHPVAGFRELAPRFLGRALLSLVVLGVTASRAMAAGDVALVIDDHRTVRLTGDALANDVTVLPGEQNGTWVVTGEGGTTINGQASVVVSGPRGLRAELGDGDDRIEVRGIVLDRDLRLTLGAGDDRTLVRDVIVRRRVTWSGDDGDDSFTAEGSCVFRGGVKLTGGSGADSVTIRDSRFLGPTRIRGNHGHDAVIVRRTSFAKSARVSVITGKGEDRVTFDTCILDQYVFVATGNASDYVLVVDCHANSDFECVLGRSNDRIDIDDTTFNKDVGVDGDLGRDRLDFDGHVNFRGAERRPDRYDVRFHDFERVD